MSLASIIKRQNKTRDLDPEQIEAHVKEHLEDYQELIAFWRYYPDRLVDYYLSLGNPFNFQFYFYQRLCKKVCYFVRSNYKDS